MEENKKSASPKKTVPVARRIVSCVSKGGMSLPVDSRHNQPRLIALAVAIHNTPSPMAGLLHIEIAGVVRRVMRMVSALFPRLLLHIRASQGGVMSLKLK